MSQQSILLPLFVQVGLTFFLILWMAKERTGLLKRRAVNWRNIALRQNPWPGRAQQIGNCFENQFEIPVLFYVLVVLAIITKKADLPFVVMEWLFVATRIAHAIVFTTSNYVPLRGQFYIAGTLILLLMWGLFAVRIFAGSSIGAL
ncbi:MAG TPA: MAPEG family protein [Methylocella sp.]